MCNAQSWGSLKFAPSLDVDGFLPIKRLSPFTPQGWGPAVVGRPTLSSLGFSKVQR